MLREVWDHYNDPAVTVAGGANQPLGCASMPQDTPVDQFDIWIDSQYQWLWVGNVQWEEMDGGSIIERNMEFSGQNNQPCRARFSSTNPMKNIVALGVMYNLNATNAIQAVLHLNTMKIARVG